jgi:hypothetical protein
MGRVNRELSNVAKAISRTALFAFGVKVSEPFAVAGAVSAAVVVARVAEELTQ